ncbi:hypothetical protein V6N13_083742 [Hibiscus sabdariffa]|uniref:Uncharacterized protein n=1 Tax=Hibiscus sabdariffa TaxID=183260 RepID=A0ABR2SZR0_9ROSI
MERSSCSSSFQDVRNPIKLSSGCSKDRYVMRQKYLRSYPLLMAANENEILGENTVTRTKKWLKEMKQKYDCRSGDPEKKRKAWPSQGSVVGDEVKESFSSCVETCLKLLIVCMAKVDKPKIDDPKVIGFGI